MGKYILAGAAALLLCTPAIAQGGSQGYGRDFSANESVRQAWTPPSQRLYDNGNSCGPDRAEPVWGRNNELVGYSCVPEGANGS